MAQTTASHLIHPRARLAPLPAGQRCHPRDHYARAVERSITNYHQDEAGDWVAELACGHDQHVRHRPPFQLRAWVLDPGGRFDRLGTLLNCPLCDRAELPEGLRWVRRSPIWDERTMPAGLRRAHRVAAGTWGRIVVQGGRLRFGAATTPTIDVELEAGSTQAIPPEVLHEVEPLGAVRCSVEFFAVDRAGQAGTEEAESNALVTEGGDPAWWAGLLCPECGAVVDGGFHRPDCSAAGAIS
jgi:tellurite methyltransferase